MSPTFLPSQVRIWQAVLPLVDTFGRVELELAAALMVFACTNDGDRWRAVTPREIGLSLVAARSGPFGRYWDNPFFPAPDFRSLAKKGFAEFVGDVETGAPIQFTDKGFAALTKNVP